MPTLKFRVSGESLSSTRMKVTGKTFEYVVDKQETSPLEYIFSALAGCINIVGFLVADEMNLTIQKMRVDIEGTINTDKLAGKNVDDRAGYKEITIDVIVESDGSEEELENWIEKVEERCPVADNIAERTPLSLSVIKK
jgi:uncharacterized OsmC-like protein